MAQINQTLRASRMLNKAYEYSKEYMHEFIMPEHLLLALIEDFNFNSALNIFFSPYQLEERIREYLESVESLPAGTEYIPEASAQLQKVIELAIQQVASSDAETLDIPHLTKGILALEDSWAAYLLKDALFGKEANFMSQLIGFYDTEDSLNEKDEESDDKAAWKRLVTCMNDFYRQQNPLVGREQELKRTVQVLCRRDKNNPLHVGEPGVGKTALVWGLARLIEEGRVPKRLKGSRVYQLDMGTLLAGTQYRGDFENRIKQIMDGVQAEGDNNIVYIDAFNNAITDIPVKMFEEKGQQRPFTATIHSKGVWKMNRYFQHYESADDEMYLCSNALGFLEVASYQADVAILADLEPGDKIIIQFRKYSFLNFVHFNSKSCFLTLQFFIPVVLREGYFNFKFFFKIMTY